MEENKNTIKLILGGVAVFVVFILVLTLSPIVIVGAGERGVVMRYGQVQDQILGEGMHFRTPFQDEVKNLSVKTRTTKITGVAGSSDSQVVTFTAQVNWRMNPNTINKTYQSVGNENAVESNYIVTKGPDAIKESVSKSTAIDFQKNRETVRNLAIENLRKRMGSSAIIEDISFTDIDFSKEFNAAIEAKVTAEQEAQAQKNKLESVKYQAQQKIETAKAEAESIKIQTAALSENQNLIELEKAKRWNGVLPQTIVGGGTIPFFNVH
jgi:prohibitin 1